jgi:hypothetical protein
VSAKAALPCGVAAAALNPLRCVSNEDFKLGAICGFFAAIVVKQASYFLMYSSHSGTPVPGSVESALAVSVFAGAVVVVVDEVVVVVFAVLVVFAGLLVAVLAAPLPQPKETTAKQTSADIAIKFLIVIKRYSSQIYFSPTRLSRVRAKIKNIFCLSKISVSRKR